MDIFEFAIDFEKEHRNFYEEKQEEVKSESVKKIFSDLAEEERKHKEILKQLQEGEKVEHMESDILPRASKAFEEIAAGLPETVLPETQVDIYIKAQEMEKRTYDFYREKAEETDLTFIKKVFTRLAEEEKKHETIMRNLVELVNRPNTWLDNAEFFHLEEY